jgi:hypothetical protein
MRCTLALWLALIGLPDLLRGQVYSPQVLLKDQIDSSDLHALAEGIFAHARAVTPRQKAEAIWRFFLTDGRFVAPGFWYHIAGFAYEEPKGEVLDPLKLLNSYGFGLCYHIAPVLQAVYRAGGFEDARVWFLTGHTVTEVFYEGGYHYFDSDMMGYNTIGKGNSKTLPVASVQEIAADGDIILAKIKSGAVDSPWYPADVAAGAIPDLVKVFTTTADNWLFPFTRYEQGHTMDFVLRPGERMIRSFEPEQMRSRLPYKLAGNRWLEFPEAVDDPRLGPASRKDGRQWATGQLEYQPPLSDSKAFYAVRNLRLPDSAASQQSMVRLEPDKPAVAVFDVQSPYVLIDAQFSMDLSLAGPGSSATVETSADNGLTWELAAQLPGPHQGVWNTVAKVLARSPNGRLNAIAGKYGYLVRFTLAGPDSGASMQNVRIASRFQLNPRSLPALSKGRNDLIYRPGPQRTRRPIPVPLDQAARIASEFVNVRYVVEADNGMLLPEPGKPASIVFELSLPDGETIAGFDVGGRFLDLRDGLAPEKLTAEVRATALAGDKSDSQVGASLEWSTSPAGPFTALWQYDPALRWNDGKPVKQVLRWPEVDRQVRDLPADAGKVYVRYRLKEVALDDIRLAVIAAPQTTASALEVTHVWTEKGKQYSHVERIVNPAAEHSYIIQIPPAGRPVNQAIIYSCPVPDVPHR